MARILRLGALAAVLGAWLALTASSWMLAAASFRTVDRLESVEADPSATAQRWRDALAASPDGPAAARYQAAEANRWMFTAFGRAQLVLAGAALLLASWTGTGVRWVAAATALAALLTAGLTLALVPWTAGLGRDLAFAGEPPPAAASAALETMQALHATYASLDLAKAALIVFAAVGCVRALARGASPSSQPWTALGRRPRPRRGRTHEPAPDA